MEMGARPRLPFTYCLDTVTQTLTVGHADDTSFITKRTLCPFTKGRLLKLTPTGRGTAFLAAASLSGNTRRTGNRVSRHLRMIVRMNMRKLMRMHVHPAYHKAHPDPHDAAGVAVPRPCLRSPARRTVTW
jgi:hypothetical protein